MTSQAYQEYPPAQPKGYLQATQMSVPPAFPHNANLTMMVDLNLSSRARAADEGYQHRQNNIRNTAPSPVYNYNSDLRPSSSNLNSPIRGLPNQQNLSNHSQVPVASMHSGQMAAPSLVPGNTSLSLAHNHDDTPRMSSVDANAMVPSDLYNHPQAQGGFPQTSPPAMTVPNRASYSQTPVGYTQQTQTGKQSPVARKTVPSPVYHPNGTPGPNFSNLHPLARLNQNNHFQAPGGYTERPQISSHASNESARMNAMALPNILNVSPLQNRFLQVAQRQNVGQSPVQQILNQSHHPQDRIRSMQGMQSRAAAPSAIPRHTTPSPFDDAEGYIITRQDRERMQRQCQRRLNNVRSSSTLRSSSTPAIRPHSVLGKRPLDPSTQNAGPGEGPPPKKAFFAPPSVPSQHRRSDGTERCLGLEATKHGVAKLTLTSQGSQGRISTLDPTDAHILSQGATTPEYVTELQGIRDLAQKGRERGDSGVSVGVDNIAPPPPSPAPLSTLSLLATLASDGKIVDKATMLRLEAQIEKKLRRVEKGVVLRFGALRDGVCMQEVEHGTRIREIVDARAAVPLRFGAGKLYDALEASSSTAAPVESNTVPPESLAINFGASIANISEPLDIVPDEYHTPAFSSIFSTNEAIELPSSIPETLWNCTRDPDGVFRAPEPRGLSEQRVDVLWELQDFARTRHLEWVDCGEGEWRRNEDEKMEGDGLALHRWAFARVRV